MCLKILTSFNQTLNKLNSWKDDLQNDSSYNQWKITLWYVPTPPWLAASMNSNIRAHSAPSNNSNNTLSMWFVVYCNAFSISQKNIAAVLILSRGHIGFITYHQLNTLNCSYQNPSDNSRRKQNTNDYFSTINTTDVFKRLEFRRVAAQRELLLKPLHFFSSFLSEKVEYRPFYRVIKPST